MSWSKWFLFNKISIEKNAPEDPGIYRIRLRDYYFAFINNKWWGLYEKTSSDKILLVLKEPFRVREYKIQVSGLPITILCTDLIYIGKSESIQNRLLEHLNGNGNSCIYELLKQGYCLEFSYLRRYGDYNQAEKNSFKGFINATKGLCPPCDCCSNECKGQGGNCISTYIIGIKIC